ncbi:MAG TPA: MFS transporter [Thermomicrobiaceae bacterium]|nr:MFS transporter [Thermomicrobiaceae bacterium]
MRINRPLRADGSLPAGPSLGTVAHIRAAAAQTFESLAVRDFRILWWGFMGSWMAMQMQQVARGYLAYELTGNALSLGLVTMAMGLPRIVLSPVGGVVADRFAKRSVLLWTQLALGLIALFQAILVATNLMTINWLIVAGLFQGAAFAINMPARQAYIPQIVGRGDNLANAVSLNSAGMNFTRVVGPALAGVLIAVSFVNLAGVYFLVAACYIWVWLSIYRVRNEGRAVMKRGASMRGSLGDGFRYIWRKPALLVLMSLGFIPLAIGMPYLSLMPVVALGNLHIGSTGLGVLLTIAGIGALFGTLAIAYLARYPNKPKLQLALGILFGVMLVGFAYFVRVDVLWAALPFLFFTGLAGDAYQALNSALIMMNTDEAVYGRVMGVYMVAQSIRPITVLPISAVADAITTPLTLLLSGGFCSAFVGGLAVFYPGYRRIGGGAPAEEAVAAAHSD